ncbi:oxidoreductase, short-chain dehydrogenase/reductase family, putative [Talaromyces stipitatus ATCC 10500]|uniref:Oxidoreductase, short-chain dehydrogenase/reductase family, putative n=1 Tax=Talaromyces stipitatus (strain ATCC 10500 / CBS 375.48 / QM 6759 / NRRL 1006) TaxID=441959 RepID=B8MG51_TALSN|nr:oxidoreductase, short-chain dehydrogenase/reductase family, putative [Talaromyces stipitatus ATCC 10500]EED15918.1 oxidoreductase, short-chain dehydrogenase/reductase family, putative [Talaromyces stipitatus ATCC 10500]
MSYVGKVVLITGGSKGIGRAVTEQFVALGAKVAINYSSDSSAADELVKTLGENNVLPIKADAGSVVSTKEMVEQTVSRFGKIDILIPNAGIMPLANLENVTEEMFDNIYQVNVKGPLFLAKAAVPHMPEGSHIVFLSTSLCHSNTILPPQLLYCSTKGAIEQITRLLSKDLASKGIIVNCVAPGPTATELFMRGKPDTLVDAIKKHSPFNRLGTPEEIAEAIVYLSGTSWVAGQTVRCNGGMI